MLEINRGLFAHALFQYGLKAGNVFLKEEKKEDRANCFLLAHFKNFIYEL